ncbi:hypothetical protein JCM19238_3881 [Vibrio ponticus]|nr:hypothetical protein JCM19238_3881 [Vibrio ponticus]
MASGDLPAEANGLQLNFCKTLACDNFGLSDAERYIVQHTNLNDQLWFVVSVVLSPPYLTI